MYIYSYCMSTKLHFSRSYMDILPSSLGLSIPNTLACSAKPRVLVLSTVSLSLKFFLIQTDRNRIAVHAF